MNVKKLFKKEERDMERLRKFVDTLCTLQAEQVFGVFRLLGVQLVDGEREREGEELYFEAMQKYLQLNRKARRRLDKLVAAASSEPTYTKNELAADLRQEVSAALMPEEESNVVHA